MKIETIKINSYGKLKNKKIELKNNINLIYGKNESGKSTLLKFILNIFYGTSKNKKGKEISDYEKYKPWNAEDFSGKLAYELDNKSKYEIFREFSKKNPIIFNEKGEDITKDYNIDKSRGSEFFYEQTQITEETFLATSVSMQQEVKVEKGMQSVLVQKISNLLGTGEDTISYKKATEKLNKKQLDEIGTERSREKPINILKREIEEKTNKINILKEIKNTEYEIEEEKNKIKNNIEEKEIKNNILKEIKKIKEKIYIEKEKEKIKENLIEENKNKIKEIKNKIQEKENEYITEKNNKKNNEEKNKINKKNNKLKILFLVLFLINIIWILIMQKISENNIIKYIFLITIPIYLIFALNKKNKNNEKIKIIEENKNKILEKINEEINSLKNEKKIIEENSKSLSQEIEKIRVENNLVNNLEKQKIIKKYNNINEQEINQIINYENIEQEINILENNINKLKIELNIIEIKKENIKKELENLSKIEEEIFAKKEEYENLLKTNESIELTKKLLEKAYEKMKNNVSPVFTRKLSENINQITKGKYTNILFGDTQGLTVELENGNYVPAERLSIGTIDQLYLSLRLAMLDQISDEKVPIILDETFVHYDDERLKNILKYLSSEFRDRQIIIFTCTKREKNILENEKINYNYIEI